jgi:sugar O-acyltransferase (sialic acid O-acetyltransferase NeuD family)
VNVVILGAKNPETGRVIDAIRAAGESGCEFVGFLDNNSANLPPSFLGLPILGGFERLDELIGAGFAFANTITGSTVSRYETSAEICRRGGRLVSLVHPGLPAAVPIGEGAYIQEQVILQAGVSLGVNCAINAGGVISHETRLGHSVFCAPGVRIAGEVEVGDGVLVGVGAVIAPRLSIGRWATIGAGAVVIRDVPDYAVVAGNPARVLRENERKYADGDVRKAAASAG